MKSRSLANAIAKAASDKKGVDPVVLDLRTLTSFTDFFVIVSGTSDRHVQAVARAIQDDLRAVGERPIGVEGEREGRWVLIDFGDVVAHVFHQEAREYYQLDRLWADAPRVKLRA